MSMMNGGEGEHTPPTSPGRQPVTTPPGAPRKPTPVSTGLVNLLFSYRYWLHILDNKLIEINQSVEPDTIEAINSHQLNFDFLHTQPRADYDDIVKEMGTMTAAVRSRLQKLSQRSGIDAALNLTGNQSGEPPNDDAKKEDNKQMLRSMGFWNSCLATWDGLMQIAEKVTSTCTRIEAGDDVDIDMINIQGMCAIFRTIYENKE